MRTLVAVAAFALLAGCGSVGPPLPPALNIPERVTELSVTQKGGQLEVGFRVTGKTTDELVVRKLNAIDLRIGPPAANMDAWANSARRVNVEAKLGESSVRADVAGFENREVAVAVRAVGPTGRAGAWSDTVNVFVVKTPPVAQLTAVAGAGGITLKWNAEEIPATTRWRVWRQAPKDKESVVVAEVADATQWFDAAAHEEDALYSYKINAVVTAGKGTAQGAMSQAVSLVYKDTFAPETPTGLTAIAGVQTVELTWDPNREPDLKGYQLWRAEANAPLAKLGELLSDSTYSDKSAAPGKTYRYAVTAVDQKGNVSKQSAVATITVP